VKILLVIICLGALFLLRTRYLSRNLTQIISDRGGPIPEEAGQEWHNLSWDRLPGGPKPLRVIKLAWSLVTDETSLFKEHTLLASSYYSQVKYLLKMGRWPTAIVFFQKAQTHRMLALAQAEHASAIELEVISATDFALAKKVPLLGFLWKDQAVAFLKAAERKLPRKEERGDGEKLDAAIIWSKLYALTKEDAYKGHIELEGLHPNMDRGQLGRVAKHVGMTFDELRDFCHMPDSMS
jgi:hypothetical protein